MNTVEKAVASAESRDNQPLIMSIDSLQNHSHQAQLTGNRLYGFEDSFEQQENADDDDSATLEHDQQESILNSIINVVDEDEVDMKPQNKEPINNTQQQTSSEVTSAAVASQLPQLAANQTISEVENLKNNEIPHQPPLPSTLKIGNSKSAFYNFAENKKREKEEQEQHRNKAKPLLVFEGDSVFALSENINRMLMDDEPLSNDKKEQVNSGRIKRPDTNALKRLTNMMIDTYQICNPRFVYKPFDMNPRRELTHPSEGVQNNGYDNVDSDYILRVSDTIITPEGKEYEIEDLMGKGTFGQVVKCQCLKTKEFVAIKVIKNKKAFKNQGVVEIKILDILNRVYDPNGENPIVRMLDFFIYRDHLCIVFELLSASVFDLLKENNYCGLSLNFSRLIVSQILDAMKIIKDARLIHCDLKPENILFKQKDMLTLKVIDVGSACFEGFAVFQYIQSRYYRSPEVLLGLPYDTGIDMWSLGCIAAELFLGIPIFPGNSEFDQLAKIIEILGLPPQHLIARSRQRDKYFILNPETQSFRFKSIEEFQFTTGIRIEPPKKYINLSSLDELKQLFVEKKKQAQINAASRDGKFIDLNNFKPTILDSEMNTMNAFIDFLKGLLRIDKDTRWTPLMAKEHPFITRQQFTGHFEPQRENDKLSSNETGEDSMSEKSTSSRDSKEYKVGSCPSKILYPQSLNQPQYLQFTNNQHQLGSSSQDFVFHNANSSIQSHRPPILSIPDEYFKGFMFGRLDQILSMTKEQLYQFVYEQNELMYRQQQHKIMMMQQQQHIMQQQQQQQRQWQQQQQMQAPSQSHAQFPQQNPNEQGFQNKPVMGSNQSNIWGNPQQQVGPGNFPQNQHPMMQQNMFMQQNQQQQQFQQQFGGGLYQNQSGDYQQNPGGGMHQNQMQQMNQPMFMPPTTQNQFPSYPMNAGANFMQQQHHGFGGQPQQQQQFVMPSEQQIFNPPPYMQQKQQLFLSQAQLNDPQYQNFLMQQQQRNNPNMRGQRPGGGGGGNNGGGGGGNKGKAGSWQPPAGLQGHKYKYYHDQIHVPGQLIRPAQMGDPQQQQFVHQNFGGIKTHKMQYNDNAPNSGGNITNKHHNQNEASGTGQFTKNAFRKSVNEKKRQKQQKQSSILSNMVIEEETKEDVNRGSDDNMEDSSQGNIPFPTTSQIFSNKPQNQLFEQKLGKYYQQEDNSQRDLQVPMLPKDFQSLQSRQQQQLQQQQSLSQHQQQHNSSGFFSKGDKQKHPPPALQHHHKSQTTHHQQNPMGGPMVYQKKNSYDKNAQPNTAQNTLADNPSLNSSQSSIHSQGGQSYLKRFEQNTKPQKQQQSDTQIFNQTHHYNYQKHKGNPQNASSGRLRSDSDQLEENKSDASFTQHDEQQNQTSAPHYEQQEFKAHQKQSHNYEQESSIATQAKQQPSGGFAGLQAQIKKQALNNLAVEQQPPPHSARGAHSFIFDQTVDEANSNQTPQSKPQGTPNMITKFTKTSNKEKTSKPKLKLSKNQIEPAAPFEMRQQSAVSYQESMGSPESNGNNYNIMPQILFSEIDEGMRQQNEEENNEKYDMFQSMI